MQAWSSEVSILQAHDQMQYIYELFSFDKEGHRGEHLSIDRGDHSSQVNARTGRWTLYSHNWPYIVLPTNEVACQLIQWYIEWYMRCELNTSSVDNVSCLSLDCLGVIYRAPCIFLLWCSSCRGAELAMETLIFFSPLKSLSLCTSP